MQPESGRNLNIMSDTKPIMTVFADTNGAGKSTISLQMREWIGELIDPDQDCWRIKARRSAEC